MTIDKRGLREGEGDLGKCVCVCERQMLCSITGRRDHRHDRLGTENARMCHSSCWAKGAIWAGGRGGGRGSVEGKRVITHPENSKLIKKLAKRRKGNGEQGERGTNGRRRR